MNIWTKYDEDITCNPVFIFLTQKCSALLNQVVRCHYSVCIPRTASLHGIEINHLFLYDHIFVPHQECLSPPSEALSCRKLTTLSGSCFLLHHSCFYPQNPVSVLSSSAGPKISILFEETHYDENDMPFLILCVDQTLSSPPSTQPLMQLSSPADGLLDSSFEGSQLFLS
eukprot:Sdes_comp11007_c0_seq1m2643